ncbi:unnamed protein product [Lactuca virosa]|uniref:Uncharacterized protein n=1 Tax=Lactuca virosa TaxID=75947 RepID=A0AAU9PFY6_9ASTR|nr:unnamed protein product [Lactuca virosa]
MASSRMARFVSEVAPPQFVSLMRRRTTKMLDTISEDEREVCMHEREAKIASVHSSFSSSSSHQAQAASAPEIEKMTQQRSQPRHRRALDRPGQIR